MVGQSGLGSPQELQMGAELGWGHLKGVFTLMGGTSFGKTCPEGLEQLGLSRHLSLLQSLYAVSLAW